MSKDNEESAAKQTPKPLRPYSEVLGNTRVMGSLLASTEQPVWLSAIPKDAPHHKYVVWLGCQVLRTPQLAETLHDIFTHLGVDHVSLGGPSSCCGIAHDRRGDKAVGDQLTRQTVKKFDAFASEQMLYWCPSCDNHLRQKDGGSFESETTKRRKSVVNFLADLLTKDKFTVDVPMRVAIHTHGGSPEQESDSDAVHQLLSRIPRLEVIAIPDLPVIGRHCNDTAVLKFGLDRYKGEMHDWISRAKREGANTIVSLYHSCHRQMNQIQMKDAPEAKIRVENYLTLISQALGLPSREDNFARCAEIGDVDNILDNLSNKLEKTGLNRELARRALSADFGSDYLA